MNLSEIIETIKKLVEVRIKIAISKLTDDLSTILTRMAVLILMLIVGLLALLFASFSLAFYLGAQMESIYLGFLAVAAGYLCALLLLYMIRNTLSLQQTLKSGLTRFIFLFKRKRSL
jgi:hypothetical protein